MNSPLGRWGGAKQSVWKEFPSFYSLSLQFSKILNHAFMCLSISQDWDKLVILLEVYESLQDWPLNE